MSVAFSKIKGAMPRLVSHHHISVRNPQKNPDQTPDERIRPPHLTFKNGQHAARGLEPFYFGTPLGGGVRITANVTPR